MIRNLARMILFLTALPLLAGCETLDPYERLNFIRDRIAPKLELQIEKNQKKEPQYANIHLGAPTFLRIFKEESVLEAWMQDSVTGRYVLFKTYPICAYSGGLGPKEKEGDLKSPEGFYAIGKNWFRPESNYHLAMNFGYPNDFDKAHGRTGSHLMLHGGCKSDGCYAMNNRQIEELYILAEQSIRAGNESVPVHIFPFRMTGTNLEAHLGNPWMRFWINLKRGYDVFEEIRIPPSVIVKDGLYTFSPDLAAPGGV